MFYIYSPESNLLTTMEKIIFDTMKKCATKYNPMDINMWGDKFSYDRMAKDIANELKRQGKMIVQVYNPIEEEELTVKTVAPCQHQIANN